MESLLSGVAPPSLVVLVFTDAGEAVLENTSWNECKQNIQKYLSISLNIP